MYSETPFTNSKGRFFYLTFHFHCRRVTHRQTVRLGSAIKLPCPVEADPPPLIRWTKDGRSIHSSWIRFRELRMGLKIKEVEAEDAGTFNCQATNGFGSVNVNYTLIIIGEYAPIKM
ncbi:Fibroblast growth factor receptor-like 1 [Goodea atripinnis]|uniref:Fibroblast growth factor receptor-like 1 n=1 Tax=Goodea atripinnis TaxID=208336 RepID=A0ABV0MPC5_9TELE